MAQAEQPSYTELAYQVLRGAEQPLTFQEVFDAIERRRPVTTRNPKATIRGALGQGPQLVGVGNGRYWYFPYCIRGSVVRLVFAEKKPANQPNAIEYEVQHALRPSFFEGGNRRVDRPLRVRLPTGVETALTLIPGNVGGWYVHGTATLREYLVNQRAAAGDSLLIRIEDVEAGQGEAWFESRLRRPDEAIAARNQELADAAYAFMRERRAVDTAIWDIAIAMLARGVYRADIAPDPLRAVMQQDRRFVFPNRGGVLGLLMPGHSTFVGIREEPDPIAFQIPPGTIYRLKVTLRGSTPPIWRRVLVPAETRLSELHRILQIAMGWTDSHLHQFEVGRRMIGVPSPQDWREVEDERTVRLVDIAPKEKARFGYKYDFGDSWYHEILVEKLLAPGTVAQAPSCIAGQRACPPEDVGGVWRYASILEILQDPSHGEHDEWLEWIGGEFDPEAFDLEAMNARLGRV